MVTNGMYSMRWISQLVIVAIIGASACGAEAPNETTPDASPTETTTAFSPSVVTDADIPSDIHRDSWGRLPLPDRSALDADGQRAFDVIVHPDSRYASGPRGPVAMWLYSPLMAEHIFPASTYLRFGTDKDQRLTELAILVTAREVQSQYEWSAHEPLALAAGLEPEVVELVKHRRSLDGTVPGLGERERVIIQFAREVISEAQVGADTFVLARQQFGDRGVMDLTGLIGYYNFVNLTLKAFNVQLASGRTRLLPNFWSANSQ